MDWLKDCFKNLGSWLLSLFDKLIDFLNEIYQDVVDFFKYLTESFDKIIAWFTSFFGSFIEKVADWFSGIVDLIPDLSGYYNTFYQNYGKAIYIADQWINLELAFSLLAAYIAIWLLFVTIKFTLKLVPTIG